MTAKSGNSPLLILLSVLMLAAGPGSLAAQPADDFDLLEELHGILESLKGDEAREAPLQALLLSAELARDLDKENPRRWYTLSRVRYWYADTQGFRAAVKLLKQARDEVETGISLDPDGGADSALGYLGWLYAAAPPWPIGFRDRKKAETLMLEALAADSDSVANRYYYGYYLSATGETEKALPYLQKARQSLLQNPVLNNQQRSLLSGIEAVLREIAD